MKKKSSSSLVFALVCLLLCAALSLGLVFFGPAEAGANQRLAQKPKLSTKSGVNWAYLSDLARYVGERFWLRQELISLRNSLVSLTGSSPVEDVLLGSEGWLYYAPTLGDYTGSKPMTEAELAACAWNLELMGAYCRDRGMDFLFVPVPNKNSLYPEHMPAAYPQAETHDAERLLALLRERQSPTDTADLFTVFRAEAETLYYAHDSHWTQRGAALGADAILAALGRSSTYFADDFPARAQHDGDLYEMLCPAWQDLEHGPVYGGGLSYTREGTDTKPDAITINTSGGREGSLLCWRDSFGNDLYPYLADAFASARFSRSTTYDLTLAESLGADTVVIELVERNLRGLITNVPKMPALCLGGRIVPQAETGETVALTLGKAGELEGHRLISGSVGPETGRVYLVCGGLVYGAFRQADGGFAAWLPEGETPERVLYELDGTLYGAAVSAVNG